MGNTTSNDNNVDAQQISDLQQQLKTKDTQISNLQSVINNFERVEDQTISQCKKDLDYENLVIEGGGTKGIAYCSAVEELEKMGILENIKRYAGSSAGAITAALLAVGYDAAEAREIVANTNFGEFLDDKFGYIRDAYKMLTDFGMCSGVIFHKFMKNKIKAKTGDANYTFSKLYKQHKIELVITGTDLTTMETKYYCRQNTPYMPIADAVRISMSIPYLFVPMEYHKSFLVDGGMIDNYPIHVFDGAYPGDPLAKTGQVPVNPRTLGLKILTPDENISYKLVDHDNKIDGIKSFTLSLVNTLMIANERRYVTPQNWQRTAVIKVPNIPLTKFDLSPEEIQQLLTAGSKGIKDYFELGDEPQPVI